MRDAAYALKDRRSAAPEAVRREVESFHTDLPKDRYSVVSVTDFARLGVLKAAWADLAACALEPNPAYEQWMLGAAMEYLAEGTAEPDSLGFGATKPDRLCYTAPPADLRIVLVYAPN